MGLETLSSKRLDPTRTAVKSKSAGVIKTIVKAATATWKTHTFSSFKIDWVTMRNAGTEDVAIAWNTDDKDAAINPEYRTLKPGADTPIFGITKDTELHLKRLAGSGSHRIEITAWG